MANLYGYNTSTARKLNEYDNLYGQNLHKELQKEITKPKVSRTTKPKAKKSLGNSILVALCFAMAFCIVGGYVKINEANNEISRLAAEYNSIVAGNQALQVKIDKAIELNELQTIAGERFGMVRPERYQMFYIDLEMSDFSETTAADEKAEKEERLAVKGAPGIITGTLNIFQ